MWKLPEVVAPAIKTLLAFIINIITVSIYIHRNTLFWWLFPSYLHRVVSNGQARTAPSDHCHWTNTKIFSYSPFKNAGCVYCNHLGCDTVQSFRWIPTLFKNMLPAFFRVKVNPKTITATKMCTACICWHFIASELRVSRNIHPAMLLSFILNGPQMQADSPLKLTSENCTFVYITTMKY